jgi:hypothetical protein
VIAPLRNRLNVVPGEADAFIQASEELALLDGLDGVSEKVENENCPLGFFNASIATENRPK